MNTNARRLNARSLVRLAAVVASIAVSGYAHAGNQTFQVSKTVSAVGVDVNTPEGARELYLRLKAASQYVCTDHRVGLEPPPVRCVEDALGNAIRSVDGPQLTLVYLRSHSIHTAQAYGMRIPIMVAAK